MRIRERSNVAGDEPDARHDVAEAVWLNNDRCRHVTIPSKGVSDCEARDKQTHRRM